jgi:hypothetical protein
VGRKAGIGPILPDEAALDDGYSVPYTPVLPHQDGGVAKRDRAANPQPPAVETSPAILMGRIFDDRGNRVTPSR